MAGHAFTITAAFIDPGWLDTHTLVVDWNDGLTETFLLAEGIQIFPFSHAYTAPGVYTVAVTLTDDDGGVDTLTFIVTVEPAGYRIWLPIITKQ